MNMDILKAKKHIKKVIEDRIICYVTPINSKEEKEKFFSSISKGISYNPYFKYMKILFDTHIIKSEIKVLSKYQGTFRTIILSCAQRYNYLLEMIKNRGTPKFNSYSKKLYGVPNSKELQLAKRILQKKYKKSFHLKNYKSEYVKKKFQKILSNNGYDWKIVISKDLTARMMIRGEQKTILISKNATFNEEELLRLKYHEIQTHIRRYENNIKLPEEIRHSFDYIETEEGLALKMEELHNCLSQSQMRIYAARTIAVHLSLTKGFYDVFMTLKNYGFDNETAFQITSRAKRGLSDTSKPGGFTKDHIYLSGKLKIDKFIKEGGKIDDLFMGRISIKDIPKVKKILKN